MSNLFNPPKFIQWDIANTDGNAFALMGGFSRHARRQGWKKEEIDLVMEKCKSGNYDNLVATLIAHTE